MPGRHGLWITLGERREDAYEQAIADRDQITYGVPTSIIKPRDAEIVVISISGRSVDYLAVSRAGKKVAMDTTVVAISRFVPVGEITVDRLLEELPKRLATHLYVPSEGATRISPKLWEQLIKLLVGSQSNLDTEMKTLVGLIRDFRASQTKHDGGLEIFERDAVACALQAWGGIPYRKKVLRSVAPSSDTDTAPFLSRLRHAYVGEDVQIAVDQITFPGMSVAKQFMVGAVQLENNGESLTIVNCNRQPLERTLGVDLLYYNHHYDSFVLVQYKRMTGHSFDGMAYRPRHDKSYSREMQRMTDVSRRLRTAKPSGKRETNMFRLSTHPFFFKLCQARIKAALDEGMVPGMYIPLGLWKRFIKTDAARGKKGGVAIGWQNAPRHLNNGEFTHLLRNGWIGSKDGQSAMLSEIVAAILENDHMLILASTSAAQRGPDLLRDSLGRFAHDDDPLAST